MSKVSPPKVDANCSVEVICRCPHCDAFEDVFEYVSEIMRSDHRAENCDIDVTCSECGNDFIVENVLY